MIEFEIDIAAISLNTFSTYNRQGRKYITARGKEWREYIQFSLKSLVNKGLIKPLGEARPLLVSYEFHFKGKRRRDWDNPIKPLQDSMQGILFKDDEQILGSDRVRRYYNRGEDKMMIKIYKTDEEDGL